jgi:3-hydroxyisobutyrate dehydrogenase-like beta-hydroxyacid dehydrogenase
MINGKPKIGWIGCGKMGIPMSSNLLKAGYEVAVWDIVKDNVATCVRQGALAGESIRKLAADRDIVISMITDDAALDAVCLNPDGLMSAAKNDLVYIDMSTVSTVASARAAKAAEENGVKYLRAPVSGTVPSAQAKTLTVFASGPRDTYDLCEPIFLEMAQKSYYVGDGEQARNLKLAINTITGLIPAMVAEALTFGLKGGLDWELMIDMVDSSVVASGMFKLKAQALKDRNYTPAFTAAQMLKDFGLVLDSAASLGQPMPLVSLVRQYYVSLVAKKRGNLDYYALLTLWEEMAGLSMT